APLVLFLSDADGRAKGGDPAVDALRVDVALDHRDFTAAADLLGRLGDAGPGPLRGLPPALRRLAKATDLGDVRGRSRELHGGALLTWPTGGQRSALAALQARDL